MIHIEWSQQYLGHQAAIYALYADPEHPGEFISLGGEGWIARWKRGYQDGQLIAKADTSLFTAIRIDRQFLVGGLDGRLYIIPDGHGAVRAIEHHRKGLYQLFCINQQLFSLGADGRLTLWDRESYLPQFSLPVSGKALRCQAVAAEDRVWIGSSDGHLHLVDVEAGKTLTSITAHQPSVFSVQYDAKTGHLISGGRDALIRRWDLTDLHLQKSIPAHWYTVNQLLLHPSRPLLVSASRDRTIKFWHSRTLELLKVIETPKYPGHIRSVNALAWLDDETLVSGGDDRSIIEWKVGE